MLEYIYICRHGFRSNWVDSSIKSGPTGMNRDPPLAVHGVEQAHELATFLSTPSLTHPHPTPELVFSSPFYRCIQTALPTAQALGLANPGAGQGVRLEHGVAEWYSPVYPNTGLHPRPGPPQSLAPLFPEGSVNLDYQSTVFPSRKGESLQDLHDRAELFVDAWVSRVEAEHPGVKCVVIFAHAASLIALGRALTGDRKLDVTAGCASTALYQRKPPSSVPSSLTNPLHESRSTSSLAAADSLLTLSSSGDQATDAPTPAAATSASAPCGTAQWNILYSGRVDYLSQGLERDWSFASVVLADDGEVINDNGDGEGHSGENWPEGLGVGMSRWLRDRVNGRGEIGVGERPGPGAAKM
ncbi:hypothetical protein IAT38_004660 [Cryptococcus sp. DSM 104549]